MPIDRHISPLPTLTKPSEIWAVEVCCHLRFPHCESHFKKYIATPFIFNLSQNATCMFEVASRCLTTVWRKLSAAHFGRTHNCNSMLVKLKYKIQMFNNKRKEIKMLAAHFGRTHNSNSMLVKLKYKIQMFKNKRVQNTNVSSPFWSHTHLWLDPQ